MREEERRKKKEERRRKNAPTETGPLPFHNRMHRNFLLFACVETPHSDHNLEVKKTTSHRFLGNVWDVVFLCQNKTSNKSFINMPSGINIIIGTATLRATMHGCLYTPGTSCDESLDSAAKAMMSCRSACDWVGLQQIWAPSAPGLHGELPAKLSGSGAPLAVLA